MKNRSNGNLIDIESANSFNKNKQLAAKSPLEQNPRYDLSPFAKHSRSQIVGSNKA